MSTKDIAAARAGKVPASVIREPWVPVGKAKIAGINGIRYKIRGAERNSEAASMVITADPSLARLGAAFRRLQSMQQATFPGDVAAEQASLQALLSTGAPLTYYDWELVSLSGAPIARSSFRMPAAPFGSSEVADYWREPPASGTLSAEDMKRARDRDIRRATFVEGRLWMLNGFGEILSMLLGDRALSRESAPDRVVDLCRKAGRLVALVREDEIVEGMSCSTDRTIVLSKYARACSWPGGARQSRFPLRSKLRAS